MKEFLCNVAAFFFVVWVIVLFLMENAALGFLVWKGFVKLTGGE